MKFTFKFLQHANAMECPTLASLTWNCTGVQDTGGIVLAAETTPMVLIASFVNRITIVTGITYARLVSAVPSVSFGLPIVVR